MTRLWSQGSVSCQQQKSVRNSRLLLGVASILFCTGKKVIYSSLSLESPLVVCVSMCSCTCVGIQVCTGIRAMQRSEDCVDV